MYLVGSAKVSQVLRCEGEDAGLPKAKEDKWRGPGGSTAKRAVVWYTMRYFCDSKSQTIPLPKTSNPLKEWRRCVKIFPWLSLLARRVLEILATSDAPERFFLYAIILRNVCVYMRPGLKYGSGPLTRRSTT